MEEIYKQRLLKLADFLDTLPPNRFKYDYWVGSDWQGKSDLSCGTTACAFGWATTIHEFRDLGLRLVEKDKYRDLPYISMSSDSNNYNLTSNEKTTKAAYLVFGLNKSQFAWLFYPGYGWNKPANWASAKDVAKHIRAFVTNPDVCSCNGEDYQDDGSF